MTNSLRDYSILGLIMYINRLLNIDSFPRSTPKANKTLYYLILALTRKSILSQIWRLNGYLNSSNGILANEPIILLNYIMFITIAYACNIKISRYIVIIGFSLIIIMMTMAFKVSKPTIHPMSDNGIVQAAIKEILTIDIRNNYITSINIVFLFGYIGLVYKVFILFNSMSNVEFSNMTIYIIAYTCSGLATISNVTSITTFAGKDIV